MNTNCITVLFPFTQETYFVCRDFLSEYLGSKRASFPFQTLRSILDRTIKECVVHILDENGLKTEYIEKVQRERGEREIEKEREREIEREIESG